jgi:hypothetical protein
MYFVPKIMMMGQRSRTLVPEKLQTVTLKVHKYVLKRGHSALGCLCNDSEEHLSSINQRTIGDECSLSESAKSICSTKDFFSFNECVAGTVLELDGLMLSSLFQMSKLVMDNSLGTQKHTSADLTFYFAIRSLLAPKLDFPWKTLALLSHHPSPFIPKDQVYPNISLKILNRCIFVEPWYSDWLRAGLPGFDSRQGQEI